jgi:hypothetical protein
VAIVLKKKKLWQIFLNVYLKAMGPLASIVKEPMDILLFQNWKGKLEVI